MRGSFHTSRGLFATSACTPAAAAKDSPFDEPIITSRNQQQHRRPLHQTSLDDIYTIKLTANCFNALLVEFSGSYRWSSTMPSVFQMKSNAAASTLPNMPPDLTEVHGVDRVKEYIERSAERGQDPDSQVSA